MAANIPSPDGLELRAKPKISARLNKKAVMIAGAVLVGVIMYIGVNISKPPKDVTKNVEEAPKELVPAIGSATSLTKGVSDQPLLLPAESPKLPSDAEGGAKVLS